MIDQQQQYKSFYQATRITYTYFPVCFYHQNTNINININNNKNNHYFLSSFTYPTLPQHNTYQTNTITNYHHNLTYLIINIIKQMSMNISWQAQKSSLFSHSNPGRTIQSMKSASNHLQQTRNLLHSSIQRITTIKAGVANTSDNLLGTNSMYNQYDEKLRKSQVYITELKKKQASNARRIKIAFWFLIIVVCWVVIRRILFPGIYRWA